MGYSSKPELTESNQEFVNRIVKIARKLDNKSHIPIHGKPDASGWNEAMKMAACPRNGGYAYAITKGLDGQAERVGYFCNKCPGCFKVHALKLEERMDQIEVEAENAIDGHWRRKVVDDDKEAKALKKRIKRNQGGRHAEFAANEPGLNEVWAYVKNGTANADDYGEAANPEDIDWNRVYANNRKTGKKFSVGKAFKKSAPAAKPDTRRVVIPQIIVKGGREVSGKAERIVTATNYVVEAKTADKALEYYAKQALLCIEELETAGIEVVGVNLQYRNYTEKEILEMWNDNVEWQMSIYAPLLSKDNGDKMDIMPRLYNEDGKKKAPLRGPDY